MDLKTDRSRQYFLLGVSKMKMGEDKTVWVDLKDILDRQVGEDERRYFAFFLFLFAVPRADT